MGRREGFSTHSALRRLLVLAVVACGLVLVGMAIAAWQGETARGERRGALSGHGVCIGYGPRAGDELAELGVAWYTDWTFASPDVPGYRRLYVVSPRSSLVKLAQAARERRGAWWAIGNEPNDRHQDNQTPAEYVAFFERAAEVIRQADPSARILSAGIANADWAWAQAFRDEHNRLTGRYPDLDGWNIHNYLLEDDQDPYDIGEFKRRIAAFRVWMDQIGDGDKPLILSEFGVLYGAGCCERPIDPPERGVAFMVETVTWLARGNLVQAWAWFMTNSGKMQFNGDLFDASGALTSFGMTYRDLVGALAVEMGPQPDLPQRSTWVR